MTASLADLMASPKVSQILVNLHQALLDVVSSMAVQWILWLLQPMVLALLRKELELLSLLPNLL
ncbi:UNVERIFIED_CONTAM: hypothetical protein NY603_33585, partial [Bacteroidetes bacterium 56_B9]